MMTQDVSGDSESECTENKISPVCVKASVIHSSWTHTEKAMDLVTHVTIETAISSTCSHTHRMHCEERDTVCMYCTADK